MASGQVNRIKRPNTWLQRPMLQNREESSCQTGAVHTWHIETCRLPPRISANWRKPSERRTVRVTRLALSGLQVDAARVCLTQADPKAACPIGQLSAPQPR